MGVCNLGGIGQISGKLENQFVRTKGIVITFLRIQNNEFVVTNRNADDKFTITNLYESV